MRRIGSAGIVEDLILIVGVDDSFATLRKHVGRLAENGLKDVLVEAFTAVLQVTYSKVRGQDGVDIWEGN